MTQPDLAIEWIINFALSELRANPDRFLPQIFSGLLTDQLAPLFGNKMVKEIKDFINKTQIPVVHGFDIDVAKLPCVSITLREMSPAQAFLGNYGFDTVEPLQQYQRVVLVPAFQPLNVTFSSDKTSLVITPPTSMPLETQALILPGLRLRDAKQQEFLIDQDPTTNNPLITAMTAGTPVTQIDTSALEVISPYSDQVVTQSAMQYRSDLAITVHANHSHRNGLWLWHIIFWSLLRYKPLMTTLFGLDLAFSSSSDYQKVAEAAPENVWSRSISLTTQTLVTWQNDPTADILAFLLTVNPVQANNTPAS